MSPKKAALLTLATFLYFAASAQDGFWAPVDTAAIPAEVFGSKYKPAVFRAYQLNEQALRSTLASAPMEGSVHVKSSPVTITVPNAKGGLETYRVVESPVMEPGLGDKYPEIKTYLGINLDRPGSTIRFDLSPTGFHAAIISVDRKTIYINAIDRSPGLYLVFDRDGMPAIMGDFECKTGVDEKTGVEASALGADDGIRRNFRLAVTTTGEFSQACLTGSEVTDAQKKAKVLSVLTTNLNRANLVFERDFGIRLNFVTGMDALLYLYSATDPFPVSSGSWNTITQSTIDAAIGLANYDIGHLLAKVGLGNENGNAGCIACVCKPTKGSAFTAHSAVQGDPLVIDVWTHEMGHQFGANHTHTFFMNEGTDAQMEPGSGSTIMGYAGITGLTDVQSHADDYFHAKSIEQVTAYLKSPAGATCATNSLTGNNPPAVNAGLDYTIPRSTPFLLTGQATDPEGDVLSYTWEQYDAFSWGNGSNTYPQSGSTTGPLFRSTMYSYFSQRHFPALETVLTGSTATKWEALPSVSRTMKFRLTVRDNSISGPANNADDMQVTVDGNSGPFAITSPNSGATWTVGEFRTITWDVAGSNSGAVNCANVAIELSTDGGIMFPYTILASTPNDGIEEIIVPNQLTTQARIRVRAIGNIFYDISNANFSIQAASGAAFNFSNPEPLTGCSGSNFSTTLKTASVLGFSSAISLSASGQPAGTNVVFSAATVNPGNSVTVSLQGSIPAGSHVVTITGIAGSVTKTRTITFNVISATNLPTLGSPADNAAGQPAYPTFSWNALAGASGYSLEIATNPSFSPVGITINGISGTSHTLTSTLVASTDYYWRVKANSVCGTLSSGARKFTTASFTCGNVSSSDLPKTILSSSPNSVTSTLSIPGSGTISDVDVIGLRGTHDYISDIGIKLKAPSGTEVTLFENICDAEQNFNLNLDDASGTTSFPCPPVGGVTVRPQSALAAFNGQNCNGTWTLTVQDHFSQDGGTLQAWGLRICLNSGSLPVSWLNFTASRNDKAVLVQWSTASEINNKYYEVQRSSDGVNFLSIGMIAAGNAPSGLQQYLFNDLRPFSGVNYYRLKQVDKDGKFSYSAIAKVTMPGSEMIYTLQPNPARGEASLLFYSALEKAEIRIIDMMGKMVGSVSKPVIQPGEKLQLPVQQLASGHYLVMIISEKQRFTEKLVIQ